MLDYSMAEVMRDLIKRHEKKLRDVNEEIKSYSGTLENVEWQKSELEKLIADLKEGCNQLGIWINPEVYYMDEYGIKRTLTDEANANESI